MNRFILSALLLMSLETMAQDNLRDQIYRYATLPLEEGGLELAEKEASLFVRHVLSQKMPNDYFVNHTKIYAFSVREEKNGGFGLGKNSALDLATEVAVVLDSDCSISILAKALGFATLPEAHEGLEYPKAQAAVFAKRFAIKEHGMGKLEAYIQLFRFAKNELGLTKKNALEYAESFLEENQFKIKHSTLIL